MIFLQLQILIGKKNGLKKNKCVIPVIKTNNSVKFKDKNKLKTVVQSSLVDFVFPFRRETLEALKWADSIISDWKITYFLGLNLWGKNRIDEAIEKDKK